MAARILFGEIRLPAVLTVRNVRVHARVYFLVIPILGAAIQTPSAVFDDIAITALLFGIATVISWKFVIRALTVWSTVLFYVEFEDGSPTVYFGRRRTIIGRILTRLWSRR